MNEFTDDQTNLEEINYDEYCIDQHEYLDHNKNAKEISDNMKYKLEDSPSEIKENEVEFHDKTSYEINEKYIPDRSSNMIEHKKSISYLSTKKEPSSGADIQSDNKPISYSTMPSNVDIKEDEQGMIIAQYELLLQQLTSQLEKQIKRNKELEIVIATQAQKSTSIIEVLRDQAEKEISELAQKLEQCNKEKEELRIKLEQIESEHKQTILEKVQENQVTAELKRKIDLDGMSKMHMGQVEENMRKVMGQINEKNIRLEAELRKKEEELFSLKNINNQLKTEVETHKEINKQLKNDYSILIKSKGEADFELQKLTSKMYTDEISSHKLLQENERLNRTINSLNDAKDAIERTMEEVKNENIELKQILTSCDKEKNILSTRLEKACRDFQTLEIELMKDENTIKLQASTINELQSDYNDLLEREKSSLPEASLTTKFISREKPGLKSRRSPEEKNEQKEQKEMKNRYQEYKQRQNTSTLGDVFKWEDESRSSQNNNSKEKLNKSGYIKGSTSENALGRRYLNNLQQNNTMESTNGRKGDGSEQITKLKSSLQMLTSEKQKLEKEYAKFPPKSEKVISQKKRKEEIEFELDLNEKNIQRTKHKLRELNAL